MDMASFTAAKYHLDLKHFDAVISCESKWDTDVQSTAKNPDGSQERSYGLVQINLDYNPTVTEEEATDPNFALDFMGKSWANGQAYHWTCWRIHNATGWL